MGLIKEIIAKADSLPPMPSVAQQVLAVANDPEFSFDQLMAAVELDQAITAHVLKIANSPYYGATRKISSLKHALTFLGANQVVDIVLTSGVVGMYKNDQKGYKLAQGELWRHSLATALLARSLGERFNYPSKSTLFTVALLHDVGKLALSEFVGSKFEEITRMMEDEGVDFLAAEKQVLGLEHALLGAKLVQKWNFPAEMVEAIAFHHDFTKSHKARDLTRLVYLANILVLSVGVGAGAAGLAVPADAGIFEELKLKSRDLDPLLLEATDILDKASDMLSLADRGR